MPIVIEEMLTTVEICDEAELRRLLRDELARARSEETACEKARPRSEAKLPPPGLDLDQKQGQE